ncbi:Dethiobiotin synthetase [Desulfovibrio sp. DV]|uniref:dethiobiotin synthase n=1 Tax=Desulfovibrio sp. DV TaxID=1844708 RepID=UPI00094B81F7|nr:dethiobiotin synthase [Desulfovibrio sp. DV]OLN28645.1 Dethiobiotin synthetase [Desulfovibrio sp. DV]
MTRYFITGTGTGIGKSYFSALFAQKLQAEGRTVRYVKPVATGYPEDDDAAFVARQAGLAPEDAVTLYTAVEPASPCFVFDPFPFAECVARIEALGADRDALLVESAGGLAVPLGQRRYNYHFALELGLEVILVVPNRLGCLSDAIVYGHFAKRHKLALSAIALNDHFAPSAREADRNAAVIAEQYTSQTIYRFDAALSNY